jgi:hypothetical protein
VTKWSLWNDTVARELIDSGKDAPGALLPILHRLQETFGYIDRQAEPLVADALNISRAEVHGVVTFYHDFRQSPPPVHTLHLGDPEEIPFLKRQTRLTFARCGIVDPKSIEDYRAHGGYAGLARALEIGPAAIVAAVTESGLRGHGGAGFPTGIKWKTVLDAQAPRKYIVCNADEGDSGTFADRMIMEGDPFVLIEGMTIAGTASF